MCSKCESQPQSGADTIEAREAAIEAEYNAGHPAYWHKRAKHAHEASKRSRAIADERALEGDTAGARAWENIANEEQDHAQTMLMLAFSLETRDDYAQ